MGLTTAPPRANDTTTPSSASASTHCSQGGWWVLSRIDHPTRPQRDALWFAPLQRTPFAVPCSYQDDGIAETVRHIWGTPNAHFGVMLKVVKWYSTERSYCRPPAQSISCSRDIVHRRRAPRAGRCSSGRCDDALGMGSKPNWCGASQTSDRPA